MAQITINDIDYPVDFIARGSRSGFISLIVVHLPGSHTKMIYRGDFHETAALAVSQAVSAWDYDETQAIQQCKNQANEIFGDDT